MLKFLINLFIKIREILICKKPLYFIGKGKIIKINKFLKLFPLFLLERLYKNYQIVYKKEDLYMITKSKLCIIPYIVNFHIGNKDYEDVIKKFNGNIPLFVVLDLLNLSQNVIIYIKYRKIGHTTEKIFNAQNSYLIKDIFN